MALTRVSPAGRVSATATPVEAFGPVLASVTVKVTLVLIAGVGLFTVLATERSASGTFTVADAALLPGAGSYVEEDAVAVFVRSVCVVTVATKLRVADAPFARFPTDHTPVPEL